MASKYQLDLIEGGSGCLTEELDFLPDSDMNWLCNSGWVTLLPWPQFGMCSMRVGLGHF